jgi:hypothetical protein
VTLPAKAIHDGHQGGVIERFPGGKWRFRALAEDSVKV